MINSSMELHSKILRSCFHQNYQWFVCAYDAKHSLHRYFHYKSSRRVYIGCLMQLKKDLLYK